MMASYCEPVRTNSDAATAYKVATVLLRAIRKAREFRLLVHLQLMRSYSAYFKGGLYYEVHLSPFQGICWCCAGTFSPTGRTGKGAMEHKYAWQTPGVLMTCCEARASLPQRCNDARGYANKCNLCRRAFHMTRE